MSFIRYLALGFFDSEASKPHALSIRKYWEPEFLVQFAQNIGGVFTDSGELRVEDKLLMKLYGGCLLYPGPWPASKDWGILERLVRESDCDIADPELGFLRTLDDLRAAQKSVTAALAQAKALWPLGEELEQAHREVVERSRLEAERRKEK